MSDTELYVELDEDGSLLQMHKIVRCKDCKHVYEHHDARGRWLLCGLQLYDEVKPEDFCSRGETEEDVDE